MKKITIIKIIGILLILLITSFTITTAQTTKTNNNKTPTQISETSTLSIPNIKVILAPDNYVKNKLSKEEIDVLSDIADVNFIPVDYFGQPDYTHSFIEDFEKVNDEWIVEKTIDGRYWINAINISKNTNKAFQGSWAEVHVDRNRGDTLTVLLKIEKKETQISKPLQKIFTIHNIKIFDLLQTLLKNTQLLNFN